MDYYKAIKRGNYRAYVKHGNINSKTMKREKKPRCQTMNADLKSYRHGGSYTIYGVNLVVVLPKNQYFKKKRN